MLNHITYAVTLLITGGSFSDLSMDLGSKVKISDYSLCKLDKPGDIFFNKLFSAPTPMNTTPVRKYQRLPSGGSEVLSKIRFVKLVSWNDIPLYGAEKRSVINPESEGMEERVLIFNTTSKDLRDRLSALGHAIPISPSYKRVSLDPHGGATMIADRGAKSALICNWDT